MTDDTDYFGTPESRDRDARMVGHEVKADTSKGTVVRHSYRHVKLDHDAKIAWAMSKKIALASFSFEAWGGANKAEMAAHTYLAETEQSRAELVLERDALLAERDALKAENQRLMEALTPSGGTKAAYIEEFSFPITFTHPRLGEETRYVSVPWTVIKEIMAMVRVRAALKGDKT